VRPTARLIKQDQPDYRSRAQLPATAVEANRLIGSRVMPETIGDNSFVHLNFSFFVLGFLPSLARAHRRSKKRALKHKIRSSNAENEILLKTRNAKGPR